MDIKPIETRYKGYRFRSRLEARWAVFFDALGIEWEYEKEGYELAQGINYLPDFYIPHYDNHDNRMWVEVKAQKFTEDELNKCRLLCAGTVKTVWLAEGLPEVKFYKFLYPVKYVWSDDLLYFADCYPYFRDSEDWLLAADSSFVDLWYPRVGETSRDDVIGTQTVSFVPSVIQLTNRLPRSIERLHGFPNGLEFGVGVKEYRELTEAVNKAKSARFEHGEKG